jgi:hypothetical protein
MHSITEQVLTGTSASQRRAAINTGRATACSNLREEPGIDVVNDLRIVALACVAGRDRSWICQKDLSTGSITLDPVHQLPHLVAKLLLTESTTIHTSIIGSKHKYDGITSTSNSLLVPWT